MIIVENGVEREATPEEEAEIIAAQDIITAEEAVRDAKRQAIADAILDSGVTDLTYAQLLTAIDGETGVVKKLSKVVWALLQERN